MAVQFVKPGVGAIDCAESNAVVADTVGLPYKVSAKPVSMEYLRGPGSLRVQHLMYLYNCSQSAIYRKIKAGHIPAPTGTDPRPWWSNEVIRQHLKGLDAINCASDGGVK